MLESLWIRGFRKRRDLSLDGFDRINFILGNNGVGKTSLLEAIFSWSCGKNVLPFTNVPLARGRCFGNQNPYWEMEELLATVNSRKQLPLRMDFDAKEDDNYFPFIPMVMAYRSGSMCLAQCRCIRSQLSLEHFGRIGLAEWG